MHSGAIEEDGGEFKVQLIEPEKEFKGSELNGVLSRDKISSTVHNYYITLENGDFSLVFDQPEGKTFKPFAGMMVDMNEEGGAKEGIITEVKDAAKHTYLITVKIAGSPKEEEVKWPSDRVAFCRELIPTRDCEKKSENPQDANSLKIDICFSQHAICAKG